MADLVRATDPELRRRAVQLAGQLVLDRARGGVPSGRGVGRPRLVNADRPGSEIDIDASLEAIVHARAERRPVALDELRGHEWSKPTVAVCLLVDSSGSMAGDRLATAGLAAAACALRAPDDHAVLVFSNSITAIKGMQETRPTSTVIDDLLALRGSGPTDLAAGLRAAARHLSRSSATRKLCVLLSDCDANMGSDPVTAAGRLHELVVIGPSGNGSATRGFCSRAGVRGELAGGPSEAVRALVNMLA